MNIPLIIKMIIPFIGFFSIKYPTNPPKIIVAELSLKAIFPIILGGLLPIGQTNGLHDFS